jgi:hypothetical protein
MRGMHVSVNCNFVIFGIDKDVRPSFFVFLSPSFFISSENEAMRIDRRNTHGKTVHGLTTVCMFSNILYILFFVNKF